MPSCQPTMCEGMFPPGLEAPFTPEASESQVRAFPRQPSKLGTEEIQALGWRVLGWLKGVFSAGFWEGPKNYGGERTPSTRWGPQPGPPPLLLDPDLAVFLPLPSPGTASSGKPVRKLPVTQLSHCSLRAGHQSRAGPRPASWWRTT